MPKPRPLLMIPGPIEVSPAVVEACSGPPPGHLAPAFMAAFAEALEAMLEVWRAPGSATPFVVAGGGTLAMESAATNLVAAGERALVVNTGYFGDRMAEMLRRRGADVAQVTAPPGDAPADEQVETALADAAGARRPFKALFATHVDTSTGVRLDPEPLAAAARRHGALSVFDGVCATAGERFEMAAWNADLLFTASQKAIGLPAGLALWVASERALEARRALPEPPPMVLDWLAWEPISRAYREGRPAYFSTPATTLVTGLRTGLAELLAEGPDGGAAMTAVVGRHRRAATALRAGWEALGLEPVPARAGLAANTLSALRFPAGRGNELVAAIAAEGVIVAGGLHAALAGSTFRIGHMGHVTRDPEPLRRTLRAVAAAVYGRDSSAARDAETAFEEVWESSARSAV